jgi:VanZ family protein
MAAIFTLSSLTPETIERTAESSGRPVPSIVNQVTVHSVEFGVLAALTYRLLASYGMLATPYLWVAVLAITMGYGASDEYHQSFVPGRVPSWLDVGYDSLGALLGLLAAELTALLRRRFGRARRT